MKINTKQCKPIASSSASSSDSFLINKNKFIPDNFDGQTEPAVITPDRVPSTATATASATTNKTSATSTSSSSSSFVAVVGSGARECKYLVTTIFTPILSSKRVDEIEKEHKKNVDTVIPSTVKDTRLKVPKSEMDAVTRKLETLFLGADDDKKGAKDDDKKKNDEEQGALMGRVYKWIFNYRTNTKNQVLRSARIMANEYKAT